MSKDLSKRYPLAIPAGVAAVMLVAALAKWPYGYYQLLRLVTCGAAAYGAYVSHSMGKSAWLWAFVLVAVLFNPVFPVHLSREVWQPLDVATAVVLVVAVFQVRGGLAEGGDSHGQCTR